MVLQTSGAISIDDIRNEYHLVGNVVSIGRLADIATVSDNIGVFYGKDYRNKYGDSNPNISQSSPGTMVNISRSNDCTVRICIGINGSNSPNPSAGWIWSKSNGGNGGGIYILNNVLEVIVGSAAYSTRLSYPIPASWTNDVTREIVWGHERYFDQYLKIDGTVRDQNTSTSLTPLVGVAGQPHFLTLPNSGDIPSSAPAAAQVAPSNIVAKHCACWKSYYAP